MGLALIALGSNLVKSIPIGKLEKFMFSKLGIFGILPMPLGMFDNVRGIRAGLLAIISGSPWIMPLTFCIALLMLSIIAIFIY